MERRPLSGALEAEFFEDILGDEIDRGFGPHQPHGPKDPAASGAVRLGDPLDVTRDATSAPGLDEAEAAHFLAVCAAAERSHQPDRLVWALGAAIAVLAALAMSGIPQRLWAESRERAVQKLINRPDLKRGWKARMGVTREDLGLEPRPDHVKPMRGDWQLF